MSPDKNNLAPKVQESGFLNSLKKAVPGAGAALTILSLATASKVASAATATVESLPEPLNSIVNDGVNHANALAENGCGDVAFIKISPDGTTATWNILNAGAIDPVAIDGQYFHLNPAANCDFVGVDRDGGAIWRLSHGDWGRSETPILTGVDQDGDGHVDQFGDDVAWDAQSDQLKAFTNTLVGAASFIQDLQGHTLINDGLHEGGADWDPDWHGGATSGRFFYEKEIGDTLQIHYKPADNLSGDSTFVAEGVAPSLSPDGTKVFFGQLNAGTGLYEVKQAVLPATADFYCDSDGDGHGDINHPFKADFDSIPVGGTFFEYTDGNGTTTRYVASSDDCDDTWAAHILPTDCNPVEDTDTPNDTVDTPDDTVDTPDDTVDTPDDTEDTPSSHGNGPDIDIRKAASCDNTNQVSTGWALGLAGVAALARRRKSTTTSETDAERRP